MKHYSVNEIMKRNRDLEYFSSYFPMVYTLSTIQLECKYAWDCYGIEYDDFHLSKIIKNTIKYRIFKK